MTREEIIALIDAKIAGQGSAVDVGGALPAILKGLADLAGQGGGGTYIGPDMPESDQMDIRRNLSLYNSMYAQEETSVGYGGQPATGGNDIPESYAKISGDSPEMTGVVGCYVDGTFYEPDELNFSVRPDGDGYGIGIPGGDLPFIVITDEVFGNTPGIYMDTTLADHEPELSYYAYVEVIEQVPAKYLPENLIPYAPIEDVPNDGDGAEDLIAAGITKDVLHDIAIGKYAGFKISAHDGVSSQDYCVPVNYMRDNNNQGGESHARVIDCSFIYNKKLYSISWIGSNVRVRVTDLPAVIKITGYPTNSSTDAEIAELGFRVDDFIRAAEGADLRLVLVDEHGDKLNDQTPVLNAYEDANGYAIEFIAKGVFYRISYDNTQAELSCTTKDLLA